MKRPAAILVTALVGTALAQAASPLRLVLDQDQIVTAQQDGKTVERLVESPKNIASGDTLQQQASATNVGKKNLRNVGISVPVPQNTVFAGGATAATTRWTVQYSFDGGKTFGAEPLKETVTVTENGQSVKKEVVVPPSRYTNVRWTIASLTPDETLKFAFRVKVK